MTDLDRSNNKRIKLINKIERIKPKVRILTLKKSIEHAIKKGMLLFFHDDHGKVIEQNLPLSEIAEFTG